MTSAEAKNRAIELTQILLTKIQQQDLTDFTATIRELKALRSEAKHEVNQGLRAVMNAMSYGPYRDYLMTEVVELITLVAFAILRKVVRDGSISVSKGSIEDVIQEAWLKEATKFHQLQGLIARLQQGQSAESLDAEDVKGLFNPLMADLLSWYSQVVANKGRDFMKMSGRQASFEKDIKNLMHKYFLKHEGGQDE
ncbi:hypothetical protein [Candidatus Uabimicrobium amorphum]|uniref:hypothetical protein n=1 Tax=Uabimicrobium amorphum TaxID=2596890 RepID=UPI00125F400D|nr:hypothetical protein [Candidatus Uabimicrobium amorphum]